MNFKINNRKWKIKETTGIEITKELDVCDDCFQNERQIKKPLKIFVEKSHSVVL